MDQEVILRGVGPAIVAALLLVALFGARLLPLAVAIGVFGAHWLLKKAAPPWPHALWHNGNGVAWAMWGVVAAALVAQLERLRVLPARVGQTAGAGVVAFAVYLVLEKVAARWSSGEVWLYVGGGGALAIATVVALRRVLSRAPRPAEGAGVSWPAILFVLLLSLDAGLVVQGRSAFAAQLCGAVTAALGAAVGLGLVVRRRAAALLPADATWLAAAHVLFLTVAVHLAMLEWLPAGLALVAPLLLLALPKELGRERPLRWFGVAAPVVLVPLLGALLLTLGEDASGY
ncbi:MAG: hypothetical protein H6835_04700 [Planctomycetes bacterium]|nr:hypothetical protein [Planctomycetota bacterium]